MQLLAMICVNICIVVESHVHAFMTDGDIFCIHIGDDYNVFVTSWGDDLGDDWYHMHIEVVSRHIAWFDMSHTCLCAWWLMWMMICILDELYTCELRNFVVCRCIKCWWTCDHNVNLYMSMNYADVEV